jgi:hypothetical protein
MVDQIRTMGLKRFLHSAVAEDCNFWLLRGLLLREFAKTVLRSLYSRVS